jgi:four helix bundle protein
MKYNFESLEVYELANDFVLRVYSITNKFPKEELFGLTSQIKRASISVVLNIVEGSGRGSKKDFARFINQAVGSLLEAKAGLLLGVKLGYCGEEEIIGIMALIDELFSKLIAFRKSLVPK